MKLLDTVALVEEHGRLSTYIVDRSVRNYWIVEEYEPDVFEVRTGCI